MADRATDLEREDQGTKSKTRTTKRVLIHPKRQGRGGGGEPGVPYTQLITSSSLDTLCSWKPLAVSSGIYRVCVEPAGKIKRLSSSWPTSPPNF